RPPIACHPGAGWAHRRVPGGPALPWPAIRGTRREALARPSAACVAAPETATRRQAGTAGARIRVHLLAGITIDIAGHRSPRCPAPTALAPPVSPSPLDAEGDTVDVLSCCGPSLLQRGSSPGVWTWRRPFRLSSRSRVAPLLPG